MKTVRSSVTPLLRLAMLSLISISVALLCASASALAPASDAVSSVLGWNSKESRGGDAVNDLVPVDDVTVGEKRYMRFGRHVDERAPEGDRIPETKRYMRFGRARYTVDDYREALKNEVKRYMRFGRAPNLLVTDDIAEESVPDKRYMRFGKRSSSQQIADSDILEKLTDDELHSGLNLNDDQEAIKRYMRFGRRSLPGDSSSKADPEKRYMRFGRFSLPVVSPDGATYAVEANKDEKRYMRFG